jgi:hypothetical protein
MGEVKKLHLSPQTFTASNKKLNPVASADAPRQIDSSNRNVLCASLQGARYADNLPANTCATSSQLACTPSEAMSTVRSPA